MTQAGKVIAVCGKGGVGKTSLSALIVAILSETGPRPPRMLVIDADPAKGLASALGVGVGKTVDDIRNEVIRNSKDGTRDDTRTVLSMLDYRVLDAMVEKDSFAFLAIGRPESDGCFCKVNTLLKTIIESLAAGFDYVIIDGEAGVEQINRRVMEKVTHLLMVTDTSAKGVSVVKTIRTIADRAVNFDRIGVLCNRVAHPDEMDAVDLGDLELLGAVPEDAVLRRFDREARPLCEMPAGPAYAAVKAAMQKFGIISR